MELFVVLGIDGGIPYDVEVFGDHASARRRGQELAANYGLLDAPLDWDKEVAPWDPRLGSQREWNHHWYSDTRDVVVARRDVQAAPL